VSVQGVDEQPDGAEETAGDVEGVTTGGTLTSPGEDEGSLPAGIADQRVAQGLGITPDLLLQRPQLPARIGQDTSEGELTDVGVGVDAQRVPGLDPDLETPSPAVLPDPPDTVEIPVDPVDAVAGRGWET
jgi:hypothetical protein